MSAYNNNFLRKVVVPSITTIPLVHEEADQAIQGGSSGQHYHLTSAEYTEVQEIPATQAALAVAQAAILALQSFDPSIYEPMMIGGELVLETAGDLMIGAASHVP